MGQPPIYPVRGAVAVFHKERLNPILSGAGNEVAADQVVGGHDLLLARFQLIEALKWMFPKR